VIKVPLGPDDLKGDERLASACREIMAEQAKLAESAEPGPLPELIGRIQTTAGPAIALANAGMPLSEVGSSGRTSADILELAIQAVSACSRLSTRAPFHGNLTPNNILVDDRGKVRFTDPVTPSFRRY
jgi:hypothetical protein